MSPTQPTPAAASEILATFPLSAGQTRCWIMAEADPGAPVLNVAVRWSLEGQINGDAIAEAFRKVIARHEILRSSFVAPDGTPVQRVHQDAPFQFSTVDLRPVPDVDQQERIETIARETAADPFDARQPGLIRATLIRLSGTRAVLCFVVDHRCFDGASIGVLGREIGAALDGTFDDLPPLPLQYGDYCLWQAELSATGALDPERAYWRKQLQDAAPFELPGDRPRNVRTGRQIATVSHDLPPGFGARLRAAARQAGVSPFTHGAAVFAAVLHARTGIRDILMTTQSTGRIEPELEPLIGMFINNLVLRFEVEPTQSLAALIAAARPVVEGALAHQQLPFDHMVAELNPARRPGQPPFTSINFGLQTVFMESRTSGEMSLRSTASHAPAAINDLDLAVMERPDGWQIVLEYDATLYDGATAEDVLAQTVAALHLSLDKPETPVADLTKGRPTDQPTVDSVAVLTGHPMVETACVTGSQAYVTPAQTGSFPLETLPGRLMSDLSDTLAGQITAISVVQQLPGPVTGHASQDTLTEMSEMWSEVLGTETLPADAHFFDLGGHSLLAIRLLARIRDRWSAPVTLIDLYETPTLGGLAALVSRTAPPLAPPVATTGDEPGIMRLRRDGPGQPFVAVNNAATAVALSTLPGQDRPISCVRLFEITSALDENTDFLEVARRCADGVRQAQPRGPYLLYGNCVHGNLALEAARILQSEGETIAGVAMRDVWEPRFAQKVHSDRRLRSQDRWFALRLRLKDWRSGHLSTAALLGSYGIFHRTGVIRALHRLRLIEHTQWTDMEAEMERFISRMSRARDRYRPEPIDFPVLHVITPITPRGRLWKTSMGWEDVVAPDKLETHWMPEVVLSEISRTGIESFAETMDAFLARHAPQ
ncbi:hypothetical protein JANAI62_24660 [Jannaschia pagri]|uniref:Carrier domain-containing protein n=1 Tax=Jannaschia pagri TaxID=2829797 RepID=A0ABQ4NN46_9RHOB|nr:MULTISPECIES: condensation domain-containing protein [unclassified Jannaschia]GIT92009.1 hypothetical protein JANAI61_24670 [Jannaschia sp. AI_61]GIT95843.1 hypothetical protein JANAI62_24660 [Jannaschia sp. AI_62]